MTAQLDIVDWIGLHSIQAASNRFSQQASGVLIYLNTPLRVDAQTIMEGLKIYPANARKHLDFGLGLGCSTAYALGLWALKM